MNRQEVDEMIKEAIDFAMAKHNRNATLISMALGLIIMAAFIDGLLRVLGIIPPFLDIDVSIVQKIIDKLLDILE
tara:strand:- start:944 stop:1168 length:225 start_codon:yes stop_codon:yes gene_type:complete